MRLREDPLPGFTRPDDLIRKAAVALRPPAMISVSDCAEKHVRLNNPGSYVGPFRNEMTPYIVEPQDRAISRSIDEIHFVAPSQIAKSQLYLNILAHAIKYRPADGLLIQPTKDMAIDFADRRIQRKMIDVSPDLAAEIGASRSDDKILTKSFKNGMMLSVGWPAPGQLASRAVPLVIFDELDRMPDDIKGEGNPIELGRNRKRSFGKNGSLINVSSPSRGFATGIVGHYYEGDQRLWFWPCPECGEYFSPGFDVNRKPTLHHLGFDPKATPQEARYNAWMICPHNGCIIEEKHKAKMNAAGVWLALGQSIDAKGKITGTPHRTRVASYWISGFAAPFVEWGELAEKLLKAQAKFDTEQDENDLKAVINTAFGFPYIPRHAGALPIEIEELERHRKDYALRTVPDGVRFMLASVDVGAHKFDVMVQGFDEEGKSWLIDRYTLKEAADGRPLDPANILKDWDQLLPLISARYPLARDPDKGIVVGAVAIDSGGAAGEDEDGNITAGVSLLAKDFARGLYRGGVPKWQVKLIKGASLRTRPILPQTPTREKDDNGKEIKGGVLTYVLGVHSLKNMIDNRLRLTRELPGYIFFPRDVDPMTLKELTGEQKIKGKWIRKGPQESFDLMVYIEALRQMIKPDRVVDWNSPPIWAAEVSMNVSSPELAPKKQAPRPTGRRMRSKGKSWRD